MDWSVNHFAPLFFWIWARKNEKLPKRLQRKPKKRQSKQQIFKQMSQLPGLEFVGRTPALGIPEAASYWGGWLLTCKVSLPTLVFPRPNAQFEKRWAFFIWRIPKKCENPEGLGHIDAGIVFSCGLSMAAMQGSTHQERRSRKKRENRDLSVPASLPNGFSTCLTHWEEKANTPFLVGGLVAIFYFPINIGLLIIPIDFHIFQRGGPTTKQIFVSGFLGENSPTSTEWLGIQSAYVPTMPMPSLKDGVERRDWRAHGKGWWVGSRFSSGFGNTKLLQSERSERSLEYVGIIFIGVLRNPRTPKILNRPEILSRLGRHPFGLAARCKSLGRRDFVEMQNVGRALYGFRMGQKKTNITKNVKWWNSTLFTSLYRSKFT